MTQPIDRKTAIALAKEAGMAGMLTDVVCSLEEIHRLCNLAVAHSRKDAEPVAKLTFEAAWAEMEKRGYRYGRDALAGVKFGWKLHEDWNTTNPPEVGKLLQQALEAADKFCVKVQTGQARSVETYDDLTLLSKNIRTYLEGKK